MSLIFSNHFVPAVISNFTDFTDFYFTHLKLTGHFVSRIFFGNYLQVKLYSEFQYSRVVSFGSESNDFNLQ